MRVDFRHAAAKMLAMPILVQKFGGTSVADAHRIHLAARRAIRAKLAGRQVVLVVSAMGHTTDHLIELAQQVTRRPEKREMDMLISTGEQVSIALVAMAIHEAGHEAISMTGAQVGMLTSAEHTRARIRSIDADRIRQQLDRGRIVIVAGFQGVDSDFNITTLGRGGSDTTAVALAAALGAEMCEIYTDVDGVYTADPRRVPQARKIDRISYDEMLELASLGAGVMHGRSIEIAKKFGVIVHVRSSLSDTAGTMIMDTQRERGAPGEARATGIEDVSVTGASLKPEVGRLTFVGLPCRPEAVAAIFDELAARRIMVDDIIQNVVDDVDGRYGLPARSESLTGLPARPDAHEPSPSAASSAAPGMDASATIPSRTSDRRATLSFTVEGHDLGPALAVAELVAQRFPGVRLERDENLARVSVVGVGMRSQSGVAATMFSALAAANIAIENISTSEIVISVLVRREDGERALQAVHAAFALDRAAG